MPFFLSESTPTNFAVFRYTFMPGNFEGASSKTGEGASRLHFFCLHCLSLGTRAPYGVERLLHHLLFAFSLTVPYYPGRLKSLFPYLVIHGQMSTESMGVREVERGQEKSMYTWVGCKTRSSL